MVDVAHLERMGRELKCPICLGLLRTTVSLSCNHTFCSLCISRSMKSGSSCPVCKVPYTRREVRPAPHMDSLVEIYKSMELDSGVNLFLTQNLPSMGKKGLEDKRDLDQPIVNKPSEAKRKRQGLSKAKAIKSINESPEAHKVVAPSFFKKKRIQISPHLRRRFSESPLPSDDVVKLDWNGTGGDKGKLSYRKGSSGRGDISDVGREGHPPTTSRGIDDFDQERNASLVPFFWLREQDDDDETDGQQRDQQQEMDHVSDTPTYALPSFSDLKDSEDGSPEKREVDSRFEHENLLDSEMFEWTQRPGSPELHSMSSRAQGKEQPSSVEKEQNDAPDHVSNQVCEHEVCATKGGRLNSEFLQSVHIADSGSGLLTRSQKSSTSKSKSCRVGCAKETKKGSVNGNGDATLIMGGGPDKLIDEKEGNEHLLGHAYIHETVANLDCKAHGDIELNDVDHLEDANGKTPSPANKANKKVRKPSKKNTQTYIADEDNTKTRAHGSSATRSDERLDNIPRKFAVEKLSYDPSDVLDEIGNGANDQICNRENGKIEKLLPAIDLPSPERSEINVFKGEAGESNVKRCTRKKWKRRQISRTKKTCNVSVRENDPEHSPTERTCESLLGIVELPDNRKNLISEADTHMVDEERDDKEGPRPKRHKHLCSREETRSRTSNSCCTINQVDSCRRKKRKGAENSIVCSDLEPVLKETFASSNKVFREPEISGDSKRLQDKDANGPAKAVEVIAGKDLMLQRCESKSTPVCCIFCRSLDEKEVCGDMLHFANGRIVSSDYKGGSAVIHAHKNCVEWAPDVFFDDETVINLEKEVARSKRIRCANCGIKGAALGCYEKSCRKSYHVPCAKSIAECRWDMENFVMLCPLHSSLQLPNEKEQSVPQKRRIRKASQMKTMQSQPTNNTSWRWTFGASPKWVLCCSGLGNPEKELVSKFCRVAGLRISKKWCGSVTHVIASVDENGACKRTLKVLMGILEGKWIVNVNWVKACLEILEPVDERPYEITRDIHGCSNGPQRGRMRVMAKEPKLFNGFRFYFTGGFASSYKGYLQDLIVAAGGTVLQRKPVASATQRTFVLYNLELPENCKPSVASSSAVEARRREAEAMARAGGAHAVGHSWVLDSIIACSLQPFT